MNHKVHYAPAGEWGGERVNCGKYFTTDVAHSGDKSKVTCKLCLKNFNTLQRLSTANSFQ